MTHQSSCPAVFDAVLLQGLPAAAVAAATMTAATASAASTTTMAAPPRLPLPPLREAPVQLALPPVVGAVSESSFM